MESYGERTSREKEGNKQIHIKERKEGALQSQEKTAMQERKRELICKELNAQGTPSEGGSTEDE